MVGKGFASGKIVPGNTNIHGFIQWVTKLDRLKYQKNAKANTQQPAMASPVINRICF